MANYRKRSSKRRRSQEATLVGDLFRILFAVSMLIVAIMVAFFVVKNISGFSLPELRQTAESTQESESAQVLTAAAETQAKTKETGAVTTEEAAESEESSEESTAESEESAEKESDKEDSAKESASISEEGPAQDIKEKESKDVQEAERDYEESDYTTEEKPIRGGDVVGEAPTAGNDVQVNGPGADVEIGQSPVG